MEESSPKEKKTQWEKEKFLFMSYFSFSQSFFKRLVLQTHTGDDSFVFTRCILFPQITILLHTDKNEIVDTEKNQPCMINQTQFNKYKSNPFLLNFRRN